MSASQGALSLGSTLRSERIKLRSLRAIVWLVVGGLLIVLLGPIQALGQVVTDEPADAVETVGDAVAIALSGLGTSVILYGIAGTLGVTSEYPRAIRTTLTVVPRRHYVVFGKAIATAIVVFVTSVLTTVLAVVVSSIVLGRGGYDLPLADPLVLRTILGVGWYAVTWALLGQVLGWLLRSTVGAVISLLALMFVVPALVTLLPRAVVEVVYPAMPAPAASAMIESGGGELLLSPGGGFAVVTAYLVVGLLLLTQLVARRDA
jgi:hypothetical protein